MNNLIDFLKNDCLYWNMYNYFKDYESLPEIMKRSGFIKEPRTEYDSMALKNYDIISMPLNNKLYEKNAIIVTTGSFSPMHEGHVQSMIIAKEYIEKMGYNVIQGVVSLSHDAYVSFKNGGVAKRHISERTMLAYEKIEEMGQDDWIKVDRMEGEILSCAVNFSTILKRIYEYTTYHLNIKDLTVFYVYGSDNAEFSNAFVKNDIYHGVCIEREGYSFDLIKEKLIKHKNIHFLYNNSMYKDYSSTKIRSSKKSHLLEDKSKKIYLIRENGSNSVFNQHLKETLEKYLDKNIEVRLFKTSEEYLKGNIISLDKFVKSNFNIDTSRLFEISSYQRKAGGMTSLKNNLIEQIKAIPKGSYELIDDDSVSGYTIEKIKEMLFTNDIHIIKTSMLIKKYLKDDEILLDVIDARDFLINKTEVQGLVIKNLNGEKHRVPYVFPEVNLTTRATIKPSDQILFSKDICLLNLKYNNDRNDEKITDLLNLYNNFLGN